MEGRRILLNRRFILAFGILFVINLVLYCTRQEGGLHREERLIERELDVTDVDSSLERLDDLQQYDEVMMHLFAYQETKEEDPQLYLEVYAEKEKNLREERPEWAKEFDEGGVEVGEAEAERRWRVKERIKERLRYIRDYPLLYEDMEKEQERLSKFSIFSEKGTFSANNIRKTVADYGRLDGVPLRYVNGEGVQSIIQYGPVHFLLFALMVGVVLQFFEERKKGLWSLVYSTKHGRLRLALRRVGILFATVFLGTFALYGSLLLAGRLIYGTFHDLDAPVVSLPFLSEFTWPMSIFDFLVFFLLLQIVAMFVTGLFVWFLLSVIRHRGMALVVLAGAYGLGFVLYTFLPIQSNFILLKYVNAFHFLDVTESLTTYHNFPVANMAVERVEACVGFLLAAGVLLVVCNPWLSHRSRPIKRAGWLERAAGRLFDWMRGATTHLNLTLTEVYKVLWVQRGWMACVVLLWLCYDTLDFNDMVFTARQEFLNEFYQEMEGPPDDGVTQYIEGLRTDVETFDREFAQAADDWERGAITEEEWESMQLRGAVYGDYYQMGLTAVQEKMDYIEELYKEKGIKAWLVNERGYEALLGREGFDAHLDYALKGLLCLLVLLADLFAYERRSGATYLLRVSKKGREVLHRRKVFTACLFATFVWAAISVTEWMGVDHYYALHCARAPLQSLEIMRDMPLRISIGQFLAVLYAVRLLLLYMMAGVVLFLSGFWKRPEWTMVVGVVLLVPSLLYAMGIGSLNRLAVVRYYGGTEVLLEEADGLAWYAAGVVVFCLLGGVCYALSAHGWRTTLARTWKGLDGRLHLDRRNEQC